MRPSQISTRFIPLPPPALSLPVCVVGARYKAQSPAVPFRSERSDRCVRQLPDNRDLNLHTAMTLLFSLSLPGLTLK